MTGRERYVDESEIIISKTDTSGRITYANDVFLKIAGYTEHELLEKPHSLIHHPDMPCCVFQLMWDTLASCTKIFADVVNLCRKGEHYWVLAHVTPSYDEQGDIVGNHSSRRVPARTPVDLVSRLYDVLNAGEKKYGQSMAGMRAASDLLMKTLEDKGVGHDEFVCSLEHEVVGLAAMMK